MPASWAIVKIAPDTVWQTASTQYQGGMITSSGSHCSLQLKNRPINQETRCWGDIASSCLSLPTEAEQKYKRQSLEVLSQQGGKRSWLEPQELCPSLRGLRGLSPGLRVADDEAQSDEGLTFSLWRGFPAVVVGRGVALLWSPFVSGLLHGGLLSEIQKKENYKG